MLVHILNRVWSRSWSVRPARTDTNRDMDRSRSAFRQHGSFKDWTSRAEPSQNIGTNWVCPPLQRRPTFHPGDAGRPRHASPAAARRAPCAEREEVESPSESSSAPLQSPPPAQLLLSPPHPNKDTTTLLDPSGSVPVRPSVSTRTRTRTLKYTRLRRSFMSSLLFYGLFLLVSK